MTSLSLQPVTYQQIGVITGFQIVSRGSGVVNVYNGDLTNVLLVSPNPSPNLSNSIPIQPLTNGTIDGSHEQYASAQTGTVAQVTVSGATQLSPSPAQIAQQINLSGVSAALSNSVGTIPTQPINTSWGPYTFTFTNGGGYEIVFLPTVAGNVCCSDVSITHLDASGTTTYIERFTIATAGGLGNLGVIVRGNLYGNRIQVSGVTCTQAFINTIFASSPTVTGFTATVYSRPFIESATPSVVPIPFDGNLAYGTSVAIAANATVTIAVLQPYSGSAFLHLQSAVGGGFNVAPLIKVFTVGGGQIYTQYFPLAGGAFTAETTPFALDTRIHLWQIFNTTAVAGSVSGSIEVEDYI
jgi:hypothetical protein